VSEARPRTEPKGFGWFVVASFVVHAAAVAVVWMVRAADARPRFDRPPIPVDLVQLGKPRDPDLLPRKPKRPPPTPARPSTPEAAAKDAVPVPKPEAAEKPAQPERRRKEPRLSAAARRLLSRDERALDDALSKLEEPEGSEDGFVDGTTTDPSAASDPYYGRIKRTLQDAYSVPATIPEAQKPFLQAKLLLRIGPDGRVLQWEILERHPNAQFMGALERMLSSLRFPPPPKRLAATLRKEGVPVLFKPN
jgi:outer membrane biosynthesis protein TonB